MIWGVIVDVLLKIFKGLFGTDKPAETEVKHEKPPKPVGVPSDDQLLRELGLHHSGTESKNGLHDGTSGQADGSVGK